MSWDIILPFLRPLEPFLQDPDVSEIMVNGSNCVFVEKKGRLSPVPGIEMSEKSLQIAVRHIARALGDDVGPDHPLLDARLPDGSRVAAVLPPCSVVGTAIAIRKFQTQRLTARDLVARGALSQEALDLLQQAIERRENLLISGGAGTGKTTLLNALAAFIPAQDRIVVIEDTSEIQLSAANLVRLEARRELPGVNAVTIRDLLKATLRLRPDRILLGEVRGAEAFDLLTSLNTGHSGSISTLHANSAEQALARFSTCVLQAGIDLPYRALRNNIAEAIDLVIHLDRHEGARSVAQVLRVESYDSAIDRYGLRSIYERRL